MPGSYVPVFGDPDDFQAALIGEGVARFLLTGHGRLRARVTQLLLHRLGARAVPLCSGGTGRVSPL